MSLTSIAVGQFFVGAGVTTYLEPRIQGARDAQLITSDEVGDGERWASYAGATVLVLIGAFFLYLGL